MAAGRCSGCGRTGSPRRITQHIVDCPQYLDLYHRDRQRCLTPVAEYERFCREDNSAIAKAERRGVRLAERFAEINRHQAACTTRWQHPPDILE